MRYAIASLVLLAACTSSGPYCELTQATVGPVVRLHGLDCFSEPYIGADGVPRGTWAACGETWEITCWEQDGALFRTGAEPHCELDGSSAWIACNAPGAAVRCVTVRCDGTPQTTESP